MVDYAVPDDLRVELKGSEKYLELARELKNYGTRKCSDSNCNWCPWYSQQRIGTGTGGLGNKRTSGDHPN